MTIVFAAAWGVCLGLLGSFPDMYAQEHLSWYSNRERLQKSIKSTETLRRLLAGAGFALAVAWFGILSLEMAAAVVAAFAAVIAAYAFLRRGHYFGGNDAASGATFEDLK